MINLDKRLPEDKSVTLSKILWKSSILAIIFAVPGLGVFLGIYYGTGNLIVGAVIGFSLHFVTLAFSGRISKWLVKVLN